jgi:AraC family transcriptional regulator, regulatory protein of adaptative response / methylated-DNA-[protein]-cysteine methyltransferase
MTNQVGPSRPLSRDRGAGRETRAARSSVLVGRACALVQLSGEGRAPSLAGLAHSLGVSPFQLHRAFRATLDISPKQYAEALRAGRLKALLRDNHPVTAALYDAGYGSSSRLYERADAELGMTPDAYRRGGSGMHIHSIVVRSALGQLLVAATDRGVCSIKLGDTASELEADLRREYPKATIDRDLGRLSPAVTSLLEFLAGQEPPAGLPLDVQGTAFQRRVWRHLQQIPIGRTSSYGDVARAIGQPGAARAVARACASNHAALLIPCHRVVQANGALGGYHWGIERKERLLAIEQGLSTGSSTGRIARRKNLRT